MGRMWTSTRSAAHDRVADLTALQDEMLVCYFSRVLELSGKLYDEATKCWELWRLSTEVRFGFQASRARVERRISNDLIHETRHFLLYPTS